jgi:hypothetical protein
MGAGNSVANKLDMNTLRLVSCKKRQRLSPDPDRKTPDIDPSSCVEGSISCGKNDEIYVIRNKQWELMTGLSEEDRKSVCSRLNTMPAKRKPRKPRKTSLGDPGDDKLLGSTSLGDPGDDKMINLGKMKKKACSVDPKLDANPRRRAPPIQPKTCLEGSVAMGKDGKPYVISKGRWVSAAKRLSERQRELVRKRLAERLKASGRPPKTPKRKPGPKKKSASKMAKSMMQEDPWDAWENSGYEGPAPDGTAYTPAERRRIVKARKNRMAKKGSKKKAASSPKRPQRKKK